jgi:site-specific DNA recombinase
MNTPTRPTDRRNGIEERPAAIDPALHSISYIRVSTKDQATKGGEPDGLSLPAQREAIERRAATAYNTTIRVHFPDKGESARTSDRPGLQALLEYLQHHKVDYVFVHKLDRLARNRYDDIEISMAIQKSGAQLVSVTENIDETPSGMLMHGIMSSIAEFYSRNLASEVKKGLAQKARNGGTPGRAPLGYLNVRNVTSEGREMRTVHVDPERAPLVRMAFELYASGEYSIERLQKEMAEQGLTSRSYAKRHAQPLSISQLGQLLRNRYYIGIVTYEDEEFQGKHEPLVATSLFEAVQDIIDTRSRRGSRDRVDKHYLKGLLFCDRCRDNGRTSRLVFTENPGQSGAIYSYYKCLGRQRRLCDLPYLPVEVVEDAVLDHYAYVRMPENFIETMQADLRHCLEDEQATTREMHKNTTKQLALLGEQEERLLDLAVEGTLPQDKIKQRLAKLKQERVALQASLDGTSKYLGLGVSVLAAGLEMVRDPQELYRNATDAARAQLDRAFFKRLFLDERGTVTHSVLNEPFLDLHETAVVGARPPSHTNDEAPSTDAEGFDLTDTASLQPDPEVKSWSKAVLVAGAGFEPATSGL